MLRKFISLHLFAAAVCMVGSGVASAECTTCNGGCPTGACGGGHLGKLHHQPATGPCLTCETLWDDYCASKPRCLPRAKYPFQNKVGCGVGCGAGCATCNTGAGVGVYGKCQGTCDRCKPGGGLLGNFFVPKAKLGCSDQGCAECADGGAAAAIHAAPHAPALPPVVPADESTVQPEAPEAPAIPAVHVAPPKAAPAEMPSASTPPLPPVPPAPRVDRPEAGGFSWLQRALQTD